MSKHFPSKNLFENQIYLLGYLFSKMRSVTFNYAQTSLTNMSQIQI